MLKKSIIFGLKVTKGVTIMEIVPKVLATFQNTAYVSLTCKTVDFFSGPLLGKQTVFWEPIVRFSALRDPDRPSVCWQRELRLRMERQTPEDWEGVHAKHQRLQELSFGIKLRALVRKQTHSNIGSSDGSSERTRQKCCKNTPIDHALHRS